MLPWSKNDRPISKCIQTYLTLPTFVDLSQPPQKRKPYATLHNLKWVHTLDLLLPLQLCAVVDQEVATLGVKRYAKVMMKLEEILSGDFFNKHIKSGDICMLSEGRDKVDNRFFIHGGVLHLSLDHGTYERAGLQGRAIPDGGLKHKKNRFLVEINLRLPSMLHGKRGFDRVVWAAKNVLNVSMTWLFFDCSKAAAPTSLANGTTGPVDPKQDPIEPYHPRWFTLSPARTVLDKVDVPRCVHSTAYEELAADDELAAAVEEWLCLLALGSPLLQPSKTPKPDPYICRYSIPAPADADVDAPPIDCTDIVRLRWQGFVCAPVMVGILVAVSKAAAGAARANSSLPVTLRWSCLQAHGIDGDCVKLLMRSGAGGECLEWTYKK